MRTSTCFLEVGQPSVVDGEESDGRPVLRAHVGDRRTVSDRQLGHARPEELNKLANDTDLTQVLWNKIIKLLNSTDIIN